MDTTFCEKEPFPYPAWRAERAIELAGRPQLKPVPSDDKYVKAYQQYVLLYGDDKVEPRWAFIRYPYPAIAQQISCSGNREFRFILEARLLSGESYANIGARLDMDKLVIKYFEKLFFNVRRKRRTPNWVHAVIFDAPFRPESWPNGELSDMQRALLYRLFAFYGGGHVLDAVIASLAPAALLQTHREDGVWKEQAAERISCAWTQFQNSAKKRKRVIALLKLAVERQQDEVVDNSRRRKRQNDFESLVAKLISKLSDPSTTQKRRGAGLDWAFA